MATLRIAYQLSVDPLVDPSTLVGQRPYPFLPGRIAALRALGITMRGKNF